MTNKSKMTPQSKNSEHGVALIFCLFALLILTAVTASLIMFTGTETSVNYNYRTEEISFFAAKSGIYEALDRMQQSSASSIAAQIPTSAPSATGGVLYIINAGSSLTVRPWDPTNAYFDDEFCHEGYSIAGMTATSPDIPCTTVPTGSTWYSTVTSNYPWSGTSTAMPYEWVRINWKQNATQAYLTGGTTPVTSYYSVNSGGSSTTPVCWNGGSEILLSTPTGVTPAYTNCTQYQTCGASSPSLSTPVLMITSLAVTSNGSRQMVQTEAALTPPHVVVSPCGISDPYGFFAYGVGFSCSSPAFTIGGNAKVDGYNSSTPPGTYAGTKQASLGSIGTNAGAIALGTSTNIGGTVYVPNVGSATPPAPGGCPDDFSVTGTPSYGALAQSTVLPVPTITTPPNTGNPDETFHSNSTLPPGYYNNVTVQSGAVLTLTAPGTYNFNCLTVKSAGSTLTISPSSKAVTINITGAGCSSNNVVDFQSNTIINNSSGIATNLTIRYSGTGNINLTGGSSTYAVVEAPKAAVTMNGGSDFYGSILANSFNDLGGVNLHFDAADTTLSGATASTATATATGSYNTLAFHSVSY